MEHSDSPLRTPLPMPARIGSAVMLIIFFITLLTISAQAQKTTTGLYTDWSNPDSWSPSGVPTIFDDVTIAAGHTINVDGSIDRMCDDLVVNGTLNVPNTNTANNPLTCISAIINSGGTMMVNIGSKSVIVQGPLFVNGGTLNHQSGKITIYSWSRSSGSYTLPGSSSNSEIEVLAGLGGSSINGPTQTTFRRLSIITQTTGTVTANVNIVIQSLTFGGQLTISGGANLNMQTYQLLGIVNGDQTSGAGQLMTARSASAMSSVGTNSIQYEVNYTGTNQSVIGGNYMNLKLSGTGTFTLSNDVNILGTLSLYMSGSNPAINLSTRTITLGNPSISTGTLAYSNGKFYNGTFKRVISESSFGLDDLKGRFPFTDDGTNDRSLSIATDSAFYHGNGYPEVPLGGYMSVSHTSATTNSVVSPSIWDGNMEINRRYDATWTISGLTISGVGYAIRVQADGMPGIWDLSGLRLISQGDSAVGIHGGTFNTAFNPQIVRRHVGNGYNENWEDVFTLQNTFYIGTNVYVNPLPVELTSFSARLRKDVVNLNWTTATELNNFGFEIYRSNSGSTTDDDAWTLVGFVNGHGTSLSPKQYSFDDVVGATSGSIFYRLKQIDRDGTAEYSKVVSVNPGRTSFALSQNYPNPFSGATAINYSLESDEQVTLQVYDIMGNLVSTIVEEPQSAGNYVATFDPGTLNLKPGNYILRLTAGNFVENRKMVYVP
ncbi:MAG TPA: T9SS type A sorting domain-containing protein [Bacteroidota bacterium]|nr:T9SS type A sorting domain-containing protein [Bacteroidota bacterium]